MAKRKGSKRHLGTKRKAEIPKVRASWLGWLRIGLAPIEPEPSWRFLKLWLLAAFALRAAVALAGDFIIHPDEIYQYLEPAHRLVFGSGMVFWEFHAGARSWLVPGAVAGILALAKLIGLGEPQYYIAMVKLAFCAVSIALPWGMYHYARCMFGEQAGRLALIAGVLWPELVGMAHKPMTEFVSTFAILGAMGLAALPASRRSGPAFAAGALFGLAACLRFQYLPAVGILALASMLALPRRPAIMLAAGGLAAVAAVGVFETATWGIPFKSYYINFKINLVLAPLRSGESPTYLQLAWLLVGSAGGLLAAAWAYATRWRRMLPLLLAVATVLLLHTASSHKEYRFIFLTIPLWIMPVCVLLAALPDAAAKIRMLTASAVAVYSAAFLLNFLPWQNWLYEGYSLEDRGGVRFVRGQRDMFQAYRYLASLDDVKGVIDTAAAYHLTPGYYYLHHSVPLYMQGVAYHETQRGKALSQLASHYVLDASADPNPDLETLARFGSIVVQRNPETTEVLQWKENAPHVLGDIFVDLFAMAGLPNEHMKHPLYEFADE